MDNVLFLGGDKRTIYATEYLNKRGYKANCLNYITETRESEYLKEINKYDILVLPMPVSRDEYHINGTVTPTGKVKISDLYSAITDKTTVISGKLPKNDVFDTNNIYTYSDNEQYILENAYITAEGALGHLLQNSTKSLKDSSVIILGWGRIAKFLHRMILAFTSDVTIILRNIDTITTLRSNGIDARTFDELDSIISGYDVLINTVPSKVIEDDTLKLIKPNAYISELASESGGYNHIIAEQMGLKSHVLKGLPGVCAAESAGEALGKCVHSHIEKRGKRI